MTQSIKYLPCMLKTLSLSTKRRGERRGGKEGRGKGGKQEKGRRMKRGKRRRKARHSSAHS